VPYPKANPVSDDSCSSLRVVQVVRSDGFAGVEQYVANLAGSLGRRGWDVTVIGGDRRRMEAELADTGVVLRDGATLSRVVRQLREVGPADIVHAHMTGAELGVSLARRWNGGSFVSTRHFAAVRGRSLGGRLSRLLIEQRLDEELAISAFVAQSVQRPVRVLLSGVPDRPPVVLDRAPVVLVAQRLESEKQTAVALRAWSAAGLATRGWTLQVAGEGSERDSLSCLARSLGIEGSCHFLGHRVDIDALLAKAAIFLATTPADALGLAVLEAMALGTPVVAAGSGGHLETVGRCERAALFPPGDSDRAGELLVTLACDRARRESYGADLRRVQEEHFSLDHHVEEVLACYAELVASRR